MPCCGPAACLLSCQALPPPHTQQTTHNTRRTHTTHTRSIARDLSLAELQEAFRALLTRLPGLRLAVAPQDLQWSEPTRDVGLDAVPVTW